MIKKTISIVLVLVFLMTSIDVKAMIIDTDIDQYDPSVHIDNISAIELGNLQCDTLECTKLQNTYRYIFSKVYTTNSDMLIYPEYFSGSNLSSGSISFDNGAVLKINNQALPSSSADAFNYLTGADIYFGRSKAMYDGHVAILDLSKNINGQNKHLTYEADAYCNVLHTYISKHEQCFYGYDDYTQYLNDPAFPSKESTSVIFLHKEDLMDKLVQNGDPYFSVLILPDIAYGMQDIVMSELSSVKEKILEFVNKGGTIASFGKSTYILAKLGLIDESTVNPNVIVKNSLNKGYFVFNGLNDFESKLFKLGLITEENKKYASYFLSSFLFDASTDLSISEVAYFDMHDNFTFQDSMLNNISLPQSKMTALAWKPYGSGKILINSAHPASSTYKYFPLVFNTVFSSYAKNIIANLKVVQKVNPNLAEYIIPALESDVKLLGSFDIQNYFNEDITDINIEIHIGKGFLADISLLSGCTITTDGINTQYYAQKITCSIDKINEFANYKIEFPITITDPSVTQKKYNILASTGQVYYKTLSGKIEKIHTANSYMQSSMGAEVRAEYNPDPSSFYPIKGEGVYIDNVLTAENKEDTNALEVEHIAVVPLISPVVDGNDQNSLSYTLEFYNEYYQTHKVGNSYIFPFVSTAGGIFSNTRDHDYIDYAALDNKNITLTADWDTPIKTVLQNRLEFLTDIGSSTANVIIGTSTIADIINKDYAFNVDKTDIIAKQLYYSDADNYYEHATQRQMTYIDTTKVNGATAYYHGVIHNDLQNPNKGNVVTKKNLIFARNDIYFYDNQNYPLPLGISDNKKFITIDRYAKSQCSSDKKIVHGYYNDTLSNGIKSNEYENALECKQGRTRLDYENIESATSGNVVVSHYLFPIADSDDIHESSDLAGFDVAGVYTDYPEIKFVKAHSLDFELDQSTTLKGGRFIITLGGGVSFDVVDPVKDGFITFSADHLAIRDIAYTGNIITVDFIRGKMPDQTHGKPDQMKLNLEHLNTTAPVDISMDIQSLNYNLGDRQNMTVYTPVSASGYTLIQKPFLSLPAVIMKFRLKRGSSHDQSYFSRYEYFEPFVRYGVYIQELVKHRTVYAYTENHPVSDPGIVLNGAGFSTFSNIGISSIPFREYLQTGKRQVIPSSTQTSRIDYQDIWKRQWTTPIRSVMPDVPPIPPPLRNFMINTTYDLRNMSGSRMLEWQSDVQGEVLYKVKLLNNYPKFFDPTVCVENETLSNITYNGQTYPKQTHDNFYGVCYQSANDKASGQVLTGSAQTLILQAHNCVSGTCADIDGIPTISRYTGSGIGNFSSSVESFYPQHYIHENMWNLTHYDYSDDVYAKGYPYHMDNLLPNFDNLSKGILRPHNIVAQPMFKGVGYKLNYNKDYTSQFYNANGHLITGWETDNLQNKDDTLLGGQNVVQDISIENAISRNDAMTSNWIDLGNNFKNIYACMFNRWRSTVVSNKINYPNNVYRNNVVPILPELSKNDPKLTNYNCDGTSYTPDTIHSVDNVVETASKDWLYFGVGLRGGAKETINIVSKIEPFSGIRYEGPAKINDGAHFTYWNPANGPNSFLVVNNVVNVVEAIQSSISLFKEIIPVSAPTFNANVYHLITVSDSNEVNREFNETPFLKHYGFGDATTSMQVGVAKDLQSQGSVLSPGNTTTAKIEFFNNSGYDWNLKVDAQGTLPIEAVELGSYAISANDLLSGTKHTIKAPTKYNFLQYNIPSDIAPYITISPSTSNINVAPIFFDFENINVTSIRDGYKGSYFLDISVSSDFPEALRGKIYDIGVEIVPRFFERIPGQDALQDPQNIYDLKIPALRIGVKNSSGKVYYTSGYSTGIVISDAMPNDVVPVSMKKISYAQLQQIRNSVGGSPDTWQINLSNIYDTIGQGILFHTGVDLSGTTSIIIDLHENNIAKFPIPVSNGPDEATMYLLVKSHVDYMHYGENIVNQNLKTDYMDFAGKSKNAKMSDPQYRKIRASGADIKATYIAKIISSSTYEPLSVQELSSNRKNYIKISLYTENVGSAIAYHPITRMNIPKDIAVLNSSSGITVIDSGSGKTIEVHHSQDIAPGDILKTDIILVQQKDGDGISMIDYFIPCAYADDDEETLINDTSTQFDLTPTQGQNQVTQVTGGSFSLPYSSQDVPYLDISISNQTGVHVDLLLLDHYVDDPYFKLFIGISDISGSVVYADSNSGVYANTGHYSIDVAQGTTYMYGGLYSGSSSLDEYGQPMMVYEILAQSDILQIVYSPSSGIVVTNIPNGGMYDFNGSSGGSSQGSSGGSSGGSSSGGSSNKKYTNTKSSTGTEVYIDKKSEDEKNNTNTGNILYNDDKNNDKKSNKISSLYYEKSTNGLDRAKVLAYIMSYFNIAPTIYDNVFSDVSKDHVYAGYIQKAKDLCIISGYSDGTFHPDGKVDRAMAIKMLILILNKKINGDSDLHLLRTLSKRGSDFNDIFRYFIDVITDYWYSQYVYIARDLGIIRGYDYIAGYFFALFVPSKEVDIYELDAMLQKAKIFSEEYFARSSAMR